MKNCELNVRSIDEGALDEKSGMNFSEYIAILSGDTTLLEKSKLEKKVAVLESLRSVHFKEVARSRFRLERMEADHSLVENLLSKLSRDEKMYTAQLTYDKEGSKVNPIQLNGLNSIDAEQIGNYIIQLFKNWKPTDGHTTDFKIGSLYGFDCFIRQQQESYQENGGYVYRMQNALYVQHTDGGVKYTYNHGHPAADNPKLAARYFINALDRVSKVKDQYLKVLQELNINMPVLRNLIDKPFEKEIELKTLKQELLRLEREISLTIQENKLKQEQEHNETTTSQLKGAEEINRTKVIKMETISKSQEPVFRIKKSRGMKL